VRGRAILSGDFGSLDFGFWIRRRKALCDFDPKSAMPNSVWGHIFPKLPEKRNFSSHVSIQTGIDFGEVMEGFVDE
jgi:hypothetical protein